MLLWMSIVDYKTKLVRWSHIFICMLLGLFANSFHDFLVGFVLGFCVSFCVWFFDGFAFGDVLVLAVLGGMFPFLDFWMFFSFILSFLVIFCLYLPNRKSINSGFCVSGAFVPWIFLSYIFTLSVLYFKVVT